MKRNYLLVLSQLRQNARMKLTDISRQTRLPVSTIFDIIRNLETKGLIKKHSALIDPHDFGFHARVMIKLSCLKAGRQKLRKLLEADNRVNSAYKICQDFLVEAIFPSMTEVEDFLEELEEKVSLKDREVFYITKDIKRECFNPWGEQ